MAGHVFMILLGWVRCGRLGFG